MAKADMQEAPCRLTSKYLNEVPFHERFIHSLFARSVRSCFLCSSFLLYHENVCTLEESYNSSSSSRELKTRASSKHCPSYARGASISVIIFLSLSTVSFVILS